jgi:hypothetical protein
MRSGTRVQPALVRGLPLRPAGHQGSSEHPLRRHIHATFGSPCRVLPVDVPGCLPALPSDGERPGRSVALRSFSGHLGRLQRADQVVTVRAVKVTHVVDGTSLVPLDRGATRPIVTRRNPHQIKGVTRVTRNSSDSLRARTRRASDESCVPHVISMLTSDTGTSIQNYRFHCVCAPTVRLSKSRVTSVTRLERLSK